MTRRSVQKRRSAGSAMIELAIILPFLVLILFAVIEFGIAFQRWQTIGNAAREAARVGALAGCDPAVTATQIDSLISTYIGPAGLELGDVDVDPQNVCGPTGTLVSVTVTYPYEFPVLGALVPGLESGLPLTGSSVMRNE